MTKSNWITIVNRAAGGGKAEKEWPLISQLLHQHQVPFEPHFTNRRLHASIIARNKIKEGYSKIIVVGGDGTMNEVINGVFAQKRLQTTEVMLGMISVGTGNDWARMFNIPVDYEGAVQTIKQQKTFIQDAGLVSYRKNGKEWKRSFINIAGMGFGARVVERSNRMKDKGKSGPFLFRDKSRFDISLIPGGKQVLLGPVNRDDLSGWLPSADHVALSQLSASRT